LLLLISLDAHKQGFFYSAAAAAAHICIVLYCLQATMEFPDLSMGQYITRQYTQNVANALSSVTNVPSTSISTLDVRPFTGSGRRRRALLQSSGNGVQVRASATYAAAVIAMHPGQGRIISSLTCLLLQYICTAGERFHSKERWNLAFCSRGLELSSFASYSSSSQPITYPL
jgi:hypothetical protein